MACPGAHPSRLLLAALLLAMAGCGADQAADVDTRAPPDPRCDTGNAGLSLPAGFCAGVVAEHFPHLRHLTVSASGDIYAAQRNRRLGFGGIAALQDSNGDGRADRIEEFGSEGVTGVAVEGGWLYAGEDTRIVRWPLAAGELVPSGSVQVIVEGLPAGGYHGAKTFAFDGAGSMYVNIGAPSNACQEADREAGSPGRDPCPELADGGGIWRFAAATPGQRFGRDGERWASGIRHALAMAWHPGEQTLYVAQHGRDELAGNWPRLYPPAAGDRLPAEEILRLTQGSEHAWPYCYFDPDAGRYVLAPEYGGDGEQAGRCTRYRLPEAVLPAHAGPNDMLVYDAEAFPPRYRGGLFIALHGAELAHSGARAGYRVVFLPVPVNGAAPQGFADGFADGGAAEPAHRPTGLAVAPDGSLLVADSVSGRIYRIVYAGTD